MMIPMMNHDPAPPASVITIDLPVAADASARDFDATLLEHGLRIGPLGLETLQVNVGRLCNQACLHCHVDASPKREEMMDAATVDRVLEVLEAEPELRTLDITGGAPELNPHFTRMVRCARELGRHVMVRHNLTVQADPHPVTGESMGWLPEFFAGERVEVVSSLPYYAEYFTDRQRGRGVFARSIEGIRRLNQVGYGDPASGLELNLVYNPVGAFLPAAQASLEADFRRELDRRFGLRFNRLYTITNMPINRFREQLLRSGGYEAYMEKLIGAFNPSAAEGVMCRSMISVDYDGRLADCDFNQMLRLGTAAGAPTTIFDWNADALRARRILFGEHCFGCTAGAGSSCGGVTAA